MLRSPRFVFSLACRAARISAWRRLSPASLVPVSERARRDWPNDVGPHRCNGSVGFGGLFCVYSYIAPTLTQVAGLPARLRAVCAHGIRCGHHRRQFGRIVARRSCLDAHHRRRVDLERSIVLSSFSVAAHHMWAATISVFRNRHGRCHRDGACVDWCKQCWFRLCHRLERATACRIRRLSALRTSAAPGGGSFAPM